MEQFWFFSSVVTVIVLGQHFELDQSCIIMSFLTLFLGQVRFHVLVKLFFALDEMK